MSWTTVKARLRQVDLIAYGVAPAVRAAQHRWDSLWSPDLAYLSDLKSVAPARGWAYTPAHASTIQRRDPSRSLPEDTLELLRHGDKLIGRHDARKLSGRGVAEMYFSHLLSVTRYPVYETFTCLIPDVFVSSPNGVVVSNRFEALTQSAVRGVCTNLTMPHAPEEDSRQRGTYVSLLGWSSGVYAHWLIDILPRLSLLPGRLTEFSYLVPQPPKRYMLEALDLLGIHPAQIVPASRGWHRVERLMLCHAAQRSVMPMRQHVLDLARRLADAAGVPAPRPVPWRRIYVSRERAKRRIVNEKELYPVLDHYGFERICAEEMSFADQIRLFCESSAVLGAHGSGIDNDIFCPPGAKIVEIYPPDRWHQGASRLASLVGHEHWHLFARNVNRDFDMRVEPGRLDKLLAYVFDEGGAVEDEY